MVSGQKSKGTRRHECKRTWQAYVLIHLCTYALVICAATVVLSGDYLFGAEPGSGSDSADATTDAELTRYKVFSLKHISAEAGEKFLAEVGIGRVSRLPRANALLVTAPARELIKAVAILRVVDAEQPYVVKAILPASQAQEIPSKDKIAAELGNISIGTFSDPPARTSVDMAIIDVHGDAVVAVAPVNRLDEIISVIGGLQGTKAQILPAAEPNKAAEGESGELFVSLMDALVELEKKTAERLKVASVPQQAEPCEPPTDFAKIEQAAVKPAGPAKEPNLAEMVEAKKAGDEQLPEPQPEPEFEQPAIAIQPYEPEPIAGGEDIIRLDLPEKLPMAEFLAFMGEHLQLDYMYNPTNVKGDVTLRLHGKLRGPIKVKDLYPLLEAVLKFHNFVMTRKGNLVTIVPAGEALNVDPILVPEKGSVELGNVIITRIFQLKHIDTTSAKNLLTGMRLGANIAVIAETGTLIVTGYAYRMTRIEELLKMIDVAGIPKKFKFRQLKYTMAKKLIPTVKNLAGQLGTVSIAIGATSAAVARKRGESAAAFKARQTKASAAARAAAARRPTAAKAGVYLEADERTNRVLMIGFEDELAVVDELINALDVEQQDLRSLRLYDIQKVGAEEIKKKLEELGIIGRGKAATSRISVPGKTAAATTVRGIEPLVEEPQVVIIESTNSLLVNATAAQHIQIATIISYVDSETLEQAIPYEIYPLENQKPEDLAGVLQQLVQETIKDKAGKIEKVVKRGEDIVIVPDENTFSIIVYANKKNQEWIRKLIKNLDKRRPQVLIDVSLVEVTRDDKFQFDLNIIANAKGLVTGNIGVKGAADALPFATSIGNELEGGWNLGGGGLTKGFYAEDKIQALFTAMNTKNYGRILARPKVLVNDNEQGVIKTTEKTYVLEKATSFTKEGIATTSEKYVPYEAKIELSITPNISEGDLLRLEIDMTREDFERKEGVPPDYTTSNVKTIVTVPDGSTIILGGLTKLKQSKGGSKVPLFGDIPLVGGLFRTISNNDEASKLYVFVKANILRPDETVGLAQLEQISMRSRAAFEVEEDRFQREEDWPGITPEPIDPLHVLDAE